MLALVRKAVILSMLVIASSGAAPYWLHHLFSHSPVSQSLLNANGDHFGCCAESNVCTTGEDDSESASSCALPGEISQDGDADECSICYQLSQSTHLGSAAVSELVGELVEGYPLLDAQTSGHFVPTQPARGPPRC